MRVDLSTNSFKRLARYEDDHRKAINGIIDIIDGVGAQSKDDSEAFRQTATWMVSTLVSPEQFLPAHHAELDTAAGMHGFLLSLRIAMRDNEWCIVRCSNGSSELVLLNKELAKGWSGTTVNRSSGVTVECHQDICRFIDDSEAFFAKSNA